MADGYEDVTLRLPVELLDRLKGSAREFGMTLSQFVELSLEL